MKNFINFFIVISFTTLTTYSPAQNYFKIQGYVTNESKEPLIGVYVRAVDLGIGTITNENGQYEITLIEGLHRLSFTHIGYEPKRIDIPAQKNEVLNIFNND